VIFRRPRPLNRRQWWSMPYGLRPAHSGRVSPNTNAALAIAQSRMLRTVGESGLGGCTDPPAAAGSSFICLHLAQAVRQSREPLLSTVVEITLQAPPLGVAGFHDARARRRELLASVRVGECISDKLGEAGDALLCIEWEGVR
jgi:hypothetical protein